MSRIQLTNTKQSKQIDSLRNYLEKQGWTILNEVERHFKGNPRWLINDDIPNLIYSWSIQRSTNHKPIWLDFIAWYDYITYETYINDCSHCIIRHTKIQLNFSRDKSLQNSTKKKIWEDTLITFLGEISKTEKHFNY